MGGKHQLAELQLAIMQVLWRLGEATVSEVRKDLSLGRQLAYTTIGTMLTKMEQKGLVSHINNGRVNIYRPIVEREQVNRSMVTDLATRLFEGDVGEMVCHLLDGCEVTREELASLKKMIREKEKELRDAE